MPLRNTRRVAASAAVAITALMASAAPAWAAPGDASAYGVKVKVSLVGKPAVDVGPFAAAAVKGPTDSTFVGVDIPGVIKSGVINASAKRSDKTGTVNGRASTADVSLSLLKTLAGGDVSAELIEAQCEATNKGISGAAKLVGLKLGKLGTVEAAPAANTIIDVRPAGVPLAKLIFNEQIKNVDGSTTVNALHVKVLEGKDALGSGDIIVSSTTCAPESGTETTPTQTTTASATSTSTPAAPVTTTSNIAEGPGLADTGASPTLLIGGGLAALIAGFVALRIVRSRKIASD